MAIVTNSACLR